MRQGRVALSCLDSQLAPGHRSAVNKTEAPCACLLCLELSQFEIEAYGNNNKASPGKVDSWDRNDWKLLHCHQPSVAIDRAPKMQLPWPAGETDLGAGAVPLPEGGQVTAGAPQRAPSLCSSEVTHWVTPLFKFLWSASFEDGYMVTKC